MLCVRALWTNLSAQTRKGLNMERGSQWKIFFVSDASLCNHKVSSVFVIDLFVSLKYLFFSIANGAINRCADCILDERPAWFERHSQLCIAYMFFFSAAFYSLVEESLWKTVLWHALQKLEPIWCACACVCARFFNITLLYSVWSLLENPVAYLNESIAHPDEWRSLDKFHLLM